MNLKQAFCIAVALYTVLALTNCSPVGFDDHERKLDSVVVRTGDPNSVEMFEVSSTGISETPDLTNSITLSGSIGSTPAMSTSTTSDGDKKLATGFHSILSNF